MCVCVSNNVARRATTVQEFHLWSTSADANVKLVIRPFLLILFHYRISMKQIQFTLCITFISVLKIIVSSVRRLYKLLFSCSIYNQNVEYISLLGATYYFIVLLIV